MNLTKMRDERIMGTRYVIEVLDKDLANVKLDAVDLQVVFGPAKRHSTWMMDTLLGLEVLARRLTEQDK